MAHSYRIHINNDEIDLISDRIEEIQALKNEDNRIPDEYVEEYNSLFKLKDMLFNANRIEDPNDYFVYGSMRIHKKDLQRFLLHINNVHVKGLDFFVPTFNNETLDLEGLIPGSPDLVTKYANVKPPKMEEINIGSQDSVKSDDVVRENTELLWPWPEGYSQEELAEKAKNDATISKLVTKIRERKTNETIPEYEAYLEKIYKNYIDLPVVTYYPGTEVPLIRKPYPHEMYYITNDGYTFDSKYFGNRNKYYMEMVEYYTKERDKQLAEARENLLEREYVSPFDKKRVKVEKVEKIPQDIIDQAQELAAQKIDNTEEFVATLDFEPEIDSSVEPVPVVSEEVETTESRDTEDQIIIDEPIYDQIGSKESIKASENEISEEEAAKNKVIEMVKADKDLTESARNLIIEALISGNFSALVNGQTVEPNTPTVTEDVAEVQENEVDNVDEDVLDADSLHDIEEIQVDSLKDLIAEGEELLSGITRMEEVISEETYVDELDYNDEVEPEIVSVSSPIEVVEDSSVNKISEPYMYSGSDPIVDVDDVTIVEAQTPVEETVEIIPDSSNIEVIDDVSLESEEVPKENVIVQPIEEPDELDYGDSFMLDDILEVTGSEEGAYLYGEYPKDILTMTGVCDGIDAEITESQANDIIDKNEAIKEQHPGLESVIDTITSLVPVKVQVAVEPDVYDENGAKIMSDRAVMDMLNSTTTNHQVAPQFEEEQSQDVGLSDSFVPVDYDTVLSDEDVLKMSGIEIPDDGFKMGGK